jgi:Di-haem cytochrome c peroxidase
MRSLFAAVPLLCAALVSPQASAQLARPQLKPWEDPDYHKPENAFRREQLEHTRIFNKARERPPRSLRLARQNPNAYQDPDRLPPNLLLGDMLWHAPKLLGDRAAAFGLSCNSCHPNGAVTNTIDAGEHSDRPGNIDLLSDYFSATADDGVFAPRNVASMRGARFTWPYLRDGSLRTLGEGIVATIAGEFGQVPRPEYVAALGAFMAQLDFVPNAQLDDLGRLTAKASAAAQEGEKVFKASYEGFGGKSCGSCHVPDSFFTDHRPHPLRHGAGTGSTTPNEAYKTPTLINLVESWPYFFDGSARTLAEAVELIDARHHLGLSGAQKTNLTAYLAAVGAVDWPARVPTLAERFELCLPFLSLTLTGPFKDDAGIWGLTLDTVRHELRGAVLDASPAERQRVDGLVREYEKLAASAEAQRPNPQTRTLLSDLRVRLHAAAAPPRAASPKPAPTTGGATPGSP